jgi:hypothetical protein
MTIVFLTFSDLFGHYCYKLLLIISIQVFWFGKNKQLITKKCEIFRFWLKCTLVLNSLQIVQKENGPCHVSGIFLPLRVKSLPLATIYEVKIPLRKWKKSLLQRNPAQMTWAIISKMCIFPPCRAQNKTENHRE